MRFQGWSTCINGVEELGGARVSAGKKLCLEREISRGERAQRHSTPGGGFNLARALHTKAWGGMGMAWVPMSSTVSYRRKKMTQITNRSLAKLWKLQRGPW